MARRRRAKRRRTPAIAVPANTIDSGRLPCAPCPSRASLSCTPCPSRASTASACRRTCSPAMMCPGWLQTVCSMNPLPVGNLGGGAAAGGHVRDLRLAYGQSFRFDRETRGVPVAFFVGLAPPKRHEQPPGELCCDPRIEAAHSGRGHHDHLVQVGAEEGGLLAFDEVAGRAVRER